MSVSPPYRPFFESFPFLRTLAVWLPVLLALGYGFLVYLIIPKWVIVMNDDFGYLRSIIETIQQGRPWTNDWLEPWAFSLSAISALLFRSTGNFYLATVGLQIVSAALLFYFTWRLLTDRAVPSLAALPVTFLVVTFPSVFWKTLEFTALIVYLPCLLIALWACERQKWTLFFLAWALALSSRQSAAVWLLLPAGAALKHFVARRSRDTARLITLCSLGVVWTTMIAFYANRTHAQEVVTAQLWRHLNAISIARNNAVGLAVILTAMGLAAGVQRLSLAYLIELAPRFHVRRALVGIAVLLLALPFALSADSFLNVEQSGFDGPLGRWYVRGMIAAGVAGWMIGRPKILSIPFLTALASVALVSVRRDVFDYYFIDAALLGFFSVTPQSFVRNLQAAHAPEVSQAWPAVATLFVFVAATGWYNLKIVGRLKEFVDYRAGACSILERALRAKEIDPAELSEAPFGFAAWYLYPYYLRHEGSTSPALDGFGAYYRTPSFSVAIKILGKRESEIVEESGQIRSEVHPFGWHRRTRFSLIRKPLVQTSSTVPVLDGQYAPQPFPLNNEEWRDLAHQPAKE